MLTISSTTFTLDVSTYPCHKEPAPLDPGAFGAGVPEEDVSEYRFSPLLSSPAGLMKVATCKAPICVVAVEPACVTDTVPSRPMVILVALAGIVIGGCTT